MEPRKQNVDVKEPRLSKMANIDVTYVPKTKPRCFDVFSKKSRFFRYFFQKNSSYKKNNKHHNKVILKSLNYIIYKSWNTYSVYKP